MARRLIVLFLLLPIALPTSVDAQVNSAPDHAGRFILRPSVDEACKRIVLSASNTSGSDGYYRVYNSGPIEITVESRGPGGTRTCGGQHGSAKAVGRDATHFLIRAGESLDIWKGLGDDLWVHINHELGQEASGWYVRITH